MSLIKEVLSHSSEMQNVSGKLKSTSQEQGEFSREILKNIQTIHARSREILQTSAVLQENTELLNHITVRLNQNVRS